MLGNRNGDTDKPGDDRGEEEAEDEQLLVDCFSTSLVLRRLSGRLVLSREMGGRRTVRVNGFRSGGVTREISIKYCLVGSDSRGSRLVFSE